MASRPDPSASPNQRKPGRNRPARRGFEPYVPPKQLTEEENAEGAGRGFLDDEDLPESSARVDGPRPVRPQQKAQQQTAQNEDVGQRESKPTKGKSRKKRSPPSERGRQQPSQPSQQQRQRTPPRGSRLDEQEQLQEMEARIRKQVEEQMAEKLARASVMSILLQQHKQQQEQQPQQKQRGDHDDDEPDRQPAGAAAAGAAARPRRQRSPPTQQSATERAFQKAREEHARQQEAAKLTKRSSRSLVDTQPTGRREAREAAGPRNEFQGRMIELEDSIKKALQAVRGNPGVWQDFCVLGPVQTVPEYVQTKRALVELYSNFLSSDPAAADEAHVASRLWVLHRKELDMYSDALRELKKGRNPFAPVINRASRNANKAGTEGSGLTVDDLHAASREGLVRAVDAASESLTEVLSTVTDVETRWQAAHGPVAAAGVRLRSVRNIKQTILTALGDLVRYQMRVRVDPSAAADQDLPGSVDSSFAMRYYLQAKQDAPWSGRVLQHMGKLHFGDGNVFDAVECFARSMCVGEPYAARESLLEVFEQCRQEVESIGSVTALSGLSFQDHSMRFRAHFLACAGIAYTRTGADKFASSLDRCRRHLSTMIQMLPIVTNTAQQRGGASAAQGKANFYDFVGPAAGRDAQPSAEELNALLGHRHFRALEEDCFKAILICISLLTVVIDKHQEPFCQDEAAMDEEADRAFALRFHAVRAIPGLQDMVRMLFMISASMVGADGAIRDYGWEPVIAKALALLLSFLVENPRYSVLQLLDEAGWQSLQAAIFPCVMSLPRSSHAAFDTVLPEDDDLEGFEPVNARILQTKHQIATGAPVPGEAGIDNAAVLSACSAIRSKQASALLLSHVRAARCRQDLKRLSSTAVEFGGFLFDKTKRPVWRAEASDELLHVFEVPETSVPQFPSSGRQSQKLLTREEFMRALESLPAEAGGQEAEEEEDDIARESGSDRGGESESESKSDGERSQEDDGLSVADSSVESEDAEEGEQEGKDSGEHVDVAALANKLAELPGLEEPAAPAAPAAKGGLLVGVDVQAIRERQAQPPDEDSGAAPSPSHAARRAAQSKSPNHKSGKSPKHDRRGKHSDRSIPLPLSLPRRESEDLPLIVIDAANVAMRHGMKQTFSCRGIQLAINFFRMAGHEVVSFLPDYYLDFERIGELRRLAKLGIGEVRAAQIPDDIPLLQELVAQGTVVGTPPQDYDDSYCITYARHKGGYVVTNDMYRDHVKRVENPKEREALRKWIKQHCISYTFVRDEFVPNPDFDFKR